MPDKCLIFGLNMQLWPLQKRLRQKNIRICTGKRNNSCFEVDSSWPIFSLKLPIFTKQLFLS